MSYRFSPLIAVLAMAPALPAVADSTLEYTVTEAPAATGKSQPVLIKDGRVMVKGAGGDSKLDLLYTRRDESLFIIDHRKHSFMTVDQQQLDRFGRQAEALQPLLQGFGEQLGKLSPQQRAKWGQMLGGNVSLDQIAEAAKPAESASVVRTGSSRSVAGIACEQMNLFQGKSKTGDFCLADPQRLNLSGDDYATLRSLLSFSEKLAGTTQGLAGQFGIKLPNIRVQELAGVPVEMREISGRGQSSSMTLNRIVTSAVAEELMRIPDGYHSEPLPLQ